MKKNERKLIVVAVLIFGILFQSMPVLAENSLIPSSNEPGISDSFENAEDRDADNHEFEEESKTDIENSVQKSEQSKDENKQEDPENNVESKGKNEGKISEKADAEPNLPEEEKKIRSIPRQINPKITDFKLLRSNGSQLIGNKLNINERFRFSIDWDAGIYKNTLHGGDYFIIEIPDKFKFHSSQSFNFQLTKGSDIIANAVSTPKVPGDKGYGGTITVTFTDYVEGKYDIKGSLFMYALFNKTLIKEGKENVFDIIIGSFKQSESIHVGPSSNIRPDERLAKYASSRLVDRVNVLWVLRLNYAKDDSLTDVTLKDELTVKEGTGSLDGIHYIEGSFKIEEGTFAPNGSFKRTPGSKPIVLKPVFNKEKTSFTLNLGNVAGKQYLLEYKSTYKPYSGLILKNKAILSNKTDEWIKKTEFDQLRAGGTGEGKIPERIKIIKVDENSGQKLQGAEFKIVRNSTGETWVVNTDTDGKALSDILVIDEDYTITEIKAPTGYILNNKPYKVHLTAKGIVLTLKNRIETEKTSVNVKKTWEGTKTGPVTVNLLANGLKRSSVVLSDGNNWKHTFMDLDKYDNYGNKIIYTVEEEKVPTGYVCQINGDADKGFIVVNRIVRISNTYIDVDVVKKWVGYAAESVEISLLADGVTRDVVTLNKDTGWKYTFKNLPKYTSAGTEILYTVKEKPIPGYKEKISGNPIDGFLIENSKTGIVSPKNNFRNIKVKKKWIGKKETLAIVKLLANGEEIEGIILSEENNWQHIFKNLPEIGEDGEKIKYTVKEALIDGYKIEIMGDDSKGFVIKNIWSPPQTKGPERKPEDGNIEIKEKGSKETKKKKMPKGAYQTDDSFSIEIYLIVFVVSLTGLLLLIAIKKKYINHR